MQYNIIQTENYLLIVSDEKIKDGDWMQRGNEQPVFVTPDFWWDFKVPYKKIIAHLPLNTSPILEGVDLLPPLEQEADVEKLAKEDAIEIFGNDFSLASLNHQTQFKRGYNKAKEKYKFTERQLDAAIDWGIKQGREGDVTITDIDNYIQSLSQPRMPIGFECLNKEYRVQSGTLEEHREGKAGYEFYQWIGKYIY